MSCRLYSQYYQLKLTAVLISILYIGMGSFLLYLVSDFYTFLESPLMKTRNGEVRTRDLINLPEGTKNSLLLFYFLFCSIAMSTGFVWLFLTVSYDVAWQEKIIKEDKTYSVTLNNPSLSPSDYVQEVERVPGQSDKPPAYDTLALSSPPPKYESVVRISQQTTKSCFL
ncbi:Oidioi.mRNA.OKI2018_I69.chr2.g8405.t1.cds [Oikopleura dioica]|uniref:Oidioi.mRNA.OKI2018_I69.chr2.g8405.t1.cds n=1 Tax=Oikopleura dioica TaxID=34765 RepID=A0ABN7TCC6_OIKDI|nr:Oidioi.mRNA.OKI2018_I69.chr2.g8405.t1.cds [Oikopleura dioica]